MRQTLAFIHEKKGDFLNFEEIFLTQNILESLEGVEVRVVIFALVSSITIGSYFKSGFYFYIYDNRKMLKNDDACPVMQHRRPSMDDRQIWQWKWTG